MKQLLYAISFLLIVGAGAGVVLHYGNQPSPTSRIPIGSYATTEDFADQVIRTLEPELRQAPVLFLGVMPEALEGFQFAERFVESLAGTSLRYEVVVVEPGLGPEGFFPDATSLSLAREVGRLAEGIKKAREQNLRMVIIAPSELTSQRDPEGAAARLAGEHRIQVTSLTLVPLSRSRAEEKSFPLPCRTQSQDLGGMGSLGCVSLQFARGNYNVEKDPSQVTGLLGQIGERDFLALIRPATPETTEEK